MTNKAWVSIINVSSLEGVSLSDTAELGETMHHFAPVWNKLITMNNIHFLGSQCYMYDCTQRKGTLFDDEGKTHHYFEKGRVGLGRQKAREGGENK